MHNNHQLTLAVVSKTPLLALFGVHEAEKGMCSASTRTMGLEAAALETGSQSVALLRTKRMGPITADADLLRHLLCTHLHMHGKVFVHTFMGRS